MPRLPIHPGEHIRIDLEELGMSRIINGDRGISANTALRLARWIGTTPQYWLNLQMMYDLRVTEESVGQAIQDDVAPLSDRAA